MAKTTIFIIAALFVSAVCADVYLHNPRGSNNRLDEANRNVNNANRLFDSQNNNKGSYNQNDMDYYSGSILQVEWTNQHSCGNENNWCEVVIQSMCEEGTSGTGIRDGFLQDTIEADDPDNVNYGRHESGDYFNECTVRERNMGLFLADQNLNAANENTAIYTRQNTNGNIHGFECPEERDYYPYWHPTEWQDVAILTGDTSRCNYYQKESQNVANKGHCTGTRNEGSTVVMGAMYNNKQACSANGFKWKEDGKFKVDAPECLPAPWSRDNHLGNGVSGWANSYNWKLPVTKKAQTCVMRLRYNISTDDYDGWNTFADQNGANSPIEDNPTIDMGNGVNLKLALNTDQYFRTFQDRSSTFFIQPRPEDVPEDVNIYNLNVRGQRGNIVQNYPSVEYDFVPTMLTITTDDYVHRQVTGSNTTPAGAGQGSENTDRSNFVEIDDGRKNYPTKLDKIKFVPDPTGEGFNDVKRYATLNQNDNEQDDAATHQDFGLQNYEEPGHYKYMCTRNNNFTNRSQKGYVTVIDSRAGISNLATILIAIGAALVVIGAGVGTVVYGVKNPDTAVGQGVTAVTSKCSGGGSGSFQPSGYAGPSGI